MLNPMNDDIIGSAEACSILKIDKGTLSRWITSRGILTPALKLPGKYGAYLFHRADIEALAAQRASA